MLRRRVRERQRVWWRMVVFFFFQGVKNCQTGKILASYTRICCHSQPCRKLTWKKKPQNKLLQGTSEKRPPKICGSEPGRRNSKQTATVDLGEEAPDKQWQQHWRACYSSITPAVCILIPLMIWSFAFDVFSQWKGTVFSSERSLDLWKSLCRWQRKWREAAFSAVSVSA